MHRRYCNVSATDHVVDRSADHRLDRLSALAHSALILGIFTRVRMEHRLHCRRSQRRRLLPDSTQTRAVAFRHLHIRRDARRFGRVVRAAAVHGELLAERHVRAGAESST